jgi:hypothetical protein
MLLLGHRHARVTHRLLGAAVLLLALLLLLPVAPADAKKKKRPRARNFNHTTYSSPITLDRAERYLWVVNSGADTVTVIRKSSGAVVKTIKMQANSTTAADDPVAHGFRIFLK